MVGWLGPCTSHGSRQPAAEKVVVPVPFGDRHADLAADSIRNLWQKDQAALMPNRNPRTNDFT